MVPELNTTRTGKKPHLTPNTRCVLPWIFLIVPSTIILSYNCGTTLLANLAYLPPTLYERIYDTMSLEGPGAAILYLMFVFYPPRLFIVTLRSLFIGGVAGALSGMLITSLFSSTRTHTPLLGAFVGSISGMALCTTILPLPERLFLVNIATDFFDLCAHGGIGTIQIGCQYGAYPLALMFTSYLPILLLLILFAIVSTILLRIIANAISPISVKLERD